MNKKGNPAGLLKAVPLNPKMSARTKRKAMLKLQRQINKLGKLPKAKATRQPKVDLGHKVSQSILSPIVWYFVVTIGSIVMSFNPLSSAVFSTLQIGMLLTDVEEAEQGHKLLQNTIGALITFGLGRAFNDLFAWGSAVIVLGVISIVVMGKVWTFLERLT
jgi:hypothetical protein